MNWRNVIRHDVSQKRIRIKIVPYLYYLKHCRCYLLLKGHLYLKKDDDGRNSLKIKDIVMDASQRINNNNKYNA